MHILDFLVLSPISNWCAERTNDDRALGNEPLFTAKKTAFICISYARNNDSNYAHIKRPHVLSFYVHETTWFLSSSLYRFERYAKFGPLSCVVFVCLSSICLLGIVELNGVPVFQCVCVL